MKRLMLVATIVGMLLALGIAVTASAQSNTPATPKPRPCANNWVDANNDGICDNAPRDGTGQQYGRRMGQPGAGMGQGGRYGQGTNFVDKNGDGVCDNFVDANGDGVCDNCGGQHGGRGAGQGAGRGPGNGAGARQGMGRQGRP